jgi:hypothetical protein
MEIYCNIKDTNVNVERLQAHTIKIDKRKGRLYNAFPPKSNRMPTPEEKPAFKPPQGYTMRWREIKGAEKGFVLRDPQGQELGFFRMTETRQSLADVFKAHLKPEIVGQTRESMRAIIVFEDSEGRRIGSWEVGKSTNTQMETMIKDLANR